MKHKRLGNTGIKVSEIAFGTVSLGVPYGIGINGKTDMPSEPDAVELLRSALDKGINFFDTARGYGCSEDRLGKAFKGRHKDVVIATKCSHLLNEKGALPEERALRTLMKRSLNDSLSALQTDYVDVYMLHDAHTDILEHPVVLDELTNNRKVGKVRVLGVSTYNVEETRNAIESGVWDVIQLAYNMMDQRQGELFSLAEKNGVGIVVRSVLFKGILTDRGRGLHSELKAIEEHRDLYYKLLGEGIPTLSDLATKFVLSQKEVSSVLVGIDKPQYLESAVAVADGDYLDEDAMEKIRQLAFPAPEFLNLPLWDRKGWLT